MKKLASLTLAILALVAFAGPAWAAEAPASEAPAPEAPAGEEAPSQVQPAEEEAPLLTPEPTERSWCAVLHANSVSECELNCYNAGCGFDHWDYLTCDCYCGTRF